MGTPSIIAIMPIFRGLIIIIAVWLVFVLARHLYRSSQLQRRKQAQLPQNDYAATISCTLCDVHVEKTEAIQHDGRYFCSKEHVNQYQNQH